MNKQNEQTKEIVDRPVYYGQKGRALVWYWRACSAYNLASIIDGEQVTREEYDKASKLLDSCQRYALANARQSERDSTYENYANSKQREADENRLNRRREKLQKQLARYGLWLNNFGLYPTICYNDEERKNKSPNQTIKLYYFD